MNCYVFTKKQVLSFGALALALIVGAAISVSAFAKTERRLPIYSVETEEKKIAISFDAAWGNTKKVQNIN